MNAKNDEVVFETKTIKTEIKAASDVEGGMIEGYASVFDHVDSYADVISKGAFEETIKADLSMIKVLWQHKWDAPIGLPTKLSEDDHGLYFEARLPTKIRSVAEAFEMIREGLVDKTSIGFNVLAAEYFRDDALAASMPTWFNGEFRRLTKIRLREFSPVTFAANEATTLFAKKSAGGVWFIPARPVHSAKGILDVEGREVQSKATPPTSAPTSAPTAPPTQPEAKTAPPTPPEASPEASPESKATGAFEKRAAGDWRLLDVVEFASTLVDAEAAEGDMSLGVVVGLLLDGEGGAALTVDLLDADGARTGALYDLAESDAAVVDAEDAEDADDADDADDAEDAEDADGEKSALYIDGEGNLCFHEFKAAPEELDDDAEFWIALNA